MKGERRSSGHELDGEVQLASLPAPPGSAPGASAPRERVCFGEPCCHCPSTRADDTSGSSDVAAAAAKAMRAAADAEWAEAERTGRRLVTMDDAYFRRLARVALDAATPIIRAQVAEEIAAAKRRLYSRIIASAHLLDTPFSDAPDQSPWTRIKANMHALDAAIGTAARQHGGTE